jgi:Tat protein secretion system quality control protein TatD with DNase activity
MRGQQNEPAYVTYVYDKLCELLHIEQKDLEKMVEENTIQLYNFTN